MNNLRLLAALLLPALFVLLCIAFALLSVRFILAGVASVILPLVSLAFVALVAWLWLAKLR